MNAPRDHHFIPAFYLKRWALNYDKLIEYARPYHTVVSKAKNAFVTGFETDLYSFPELPAASRDILESGFFNRTDQLASDALDQLYSGNSTWRADRRSAWSRFVLNFRIRHPDPLKEIRAHIGKTWNKTDPHYEAEYAKIRAPGAPTTLAEYTASLGPEAGFKIQLRLLQSVLDNERIGQRINDMEWDVLDLSNVRFPLLTSDWPSEMILAHGVISLPIGPTKLFVAAKDKATLRQMQAANPNQIVEQTNKWVVSKARRYVYANNRQQEAFISKYMSKAMVQPPFWPSLGETHASALAGHQKAASQ